LVALNAANVRAILVSTTIGSLWQYLPIPGNLCGRDA
jgi:hypothetical protein